MDIIELNTSKSILKGYKDRPESDRDPADLHSNYSLSIYHPENKIEKIILHKHHDNIDVEYFK